MSITGRFFRMAVYAGAGAAAAYFLDPERGPARRAQAREQLEAKLGQAEQSAVPSQPADDRAPGDPTLSSAVE